MAHVEIATEGGKAAVAAMDEYAYSELRRKNRRFVMRNMRVPELRARIQIRAAELRAQGLS